MAGEDILAAVDAALADPVRVAAAAVLLQDPDGLRSLDRLTAMAHRLVGCQHVHVAVLTDRMVLVSGAGTPIGETASGELHGTLCSLTASEGALLRIGDARTDPRASDFPVVRTGEVGAYLGIPLVTRRGVVIGTMCCVDPNPHAWTDEQVAIVDDLAAAATAELELATVSAELREASERQSLVLEAGELGSFDMDLVTGELRWDRRLIAMFGYAPGEFKADLGDVSSRVHPDDRERVCGDIEAAIRRCGSYDTDYRIALEGQPLRWQRNRGRAIAGADGKAVRLMGAAYDSTRVRDADAHVARILETLPSGFCSINPQYVITYLNGSAERLLRLRRENLLGRNVFDAMPTVDEKSFRAKYGQVLRTGETVEFEEYLAVVDTWFEVRVWPSVDGFSVHFKDVSQRHRTVTDRRAALVARERALHAAERATSHLQLLAEASARMGATLEEETLADILLSAVVPQLAAWARVHLSPGTSHPQMDVSSFTLQRGEPDGALATDSLFTVPLTSRDQTQVGSLTVQLRSVDPSARVDEEKLLTNLADRASAAIDNARLYAAQHRMSEVLQRSMLTRLPKVADLDIVARYRPTADHAQVGGDWYDAFIQSDGRTVLVIGDVVGHDRHAAAAMGQLRNLLRGLSFDHGASPADMLHSVDRAIPALEVDCLATAIVACVEPVTDGEPGVRRIRWANAGHVPPVVVRCDGTVELLDTDSCLLLGVDPSADRTEHVVLLGPQDTLMLYTDGLVERRDRALSDALVELLGFLEKTSFPRQSLDDLCDVVLNQMVPAKPDDDVALIAVRPR
jgi:PAS domain S-box-containing protein